MQLRNARYDNEEKTTFTLEVEIEEGKWIPFTYLCNGEDDEASPVSQEVAKAYKEDQIEVEEYQKPEDWRERLAEEVRVERAGLLNDCDYYMMPDYPATEEEKAAVAEYRRQLRNISKQEGFPENVTWPTKPECLK